jgi:hypothetical protein
MSGRICATCAHPRLPDIETLLAQRIPAARVARQFGLSKDSVQRHLKAHSKPRIAAAIAKRLENSVLGSLAVKENRIAQADDLNARMAKVIEERALDPEMEDVPGGGTGLMIRRMKQIGGGDKAQVITEYEVDTGLIAEMRANRESVAKELGQFGADSAGGDGGMRVVIVLPGQLSAAAAAPEVDGQVVDIPVLDIRPKRIG